jgi:hypothetical protein
MKEIILIALMGFIAFSIQATSADPLSVEVREIATQIIAPLLDPAKVATLKGDRPANQRLYKILHWLELARRKEGSVPDVITDAQIAAKYADTAMAKADAKAIAHSWGNMNEFGCFSDEGMSKMRKGGSPIIAKGPKAGDGVAIDHILPRAVVPELAGKFYNLEPIPAGDNLAKSAHVRDRELEIAHPVIEESIEF